MLLASLCVLCVSALKSARLWSRLRRAVTIAQSRARTAALWSAVTCHRFGRLTGLPVKQSRVQRLGGTSRARPFDGDKSPAESADKSAHSTSPPHSKTLPRCGASRN
jgi:hypothetical protein